MQPPLSQPPRHNAQSSSGAGAEPSVETPERACAADDSVVSSAASSVAPVEAGVAVAVATFSALRGGVGEVHDVRARSDEEVSRHLHFAGRAADALDREADGVAAVPARATAAVASTPAVPAVATRAVVARDRVVTTGAAALPRFSAASRTAGPGSAHGDREGGGLLGEGMELEAWSLAFDGRGEHRDADHGGAVASVTRRGSGASSRAAAAATPVPLILVGVRGERVVSVGFEALAVRVVVVVADTACAATTALAVAATAWLRSAAVVIADA